MHLFLFPIARYARLSSGPLLAPDHGPALEPRDRPVLFQPYDVAHRVLVLLVMGVILLRTPHGLLQDRVREAALDADNDGLVLLVAHHGALQRPLRHLSISSLRRFGRALLGGYGFHARDVAAHFAHAAGILKLARGPLK